MSAPAIRGLAASLRQSIADVAAMAGKAMQDLNGEVEGFKQDVGDVQALTSDIKSARADLKAALGTGTNGGPPLDDAAGPTVASPDASASSPSPSATTMSAERTPIGFITRRG